MFWLWTILLNGGLGLAAYLLAGRVLRQPSGLPRALAAATLYWAGATFGTLGLGLAGRLDRTMLLAWVASALVAAVAASIVRRRNSQPDRLLDTEIARWDVPATVALGLVLWACLAIGTPSLMLPPKVVSDGPIYHLYFAARWWKAGRVFLIATPFGENAATYFPAGGEVWFTWLMTCWGGGRLAQVGQVPFLLMTGAAAYGMARELGAGASSALLATCIFVTSTPLLLFSFEGNVDTIFVAGYLTAAYFGLRFARGAGDAGSLVLAGLSAGLAWGTKPTAIVFVPILLAAGAVLILARKETWAARVGQIAILLGMSLLGIAYWYGRNALLTGNPLYPLHLRVFGATILEGWYTSEAMKLSQFHIPRELWPALVDIVLSVLDPRLAPFWIFAVLGVWRLGRGPGARRDAGWVWGFAAMAVLQVALYWLLIPYRTQQRFMFHALGLAVVPLARLLDRSAWLRYLAAVGVGVHLVTPHSWPFADPGQPPPWSLTDVLPMVPDAVVQVPMTIAAWRQTLVDPMGTRYTVLVLAVALGAVAVAWTWRRAAARPGRGRLVTALAATITLASVPIAAMEWGVGARNVSFPNFPDYALAWQQLELRSGRAGVRVAYAGTNIPYYLMGKGLRNEVRYVNIDEHRDWLLHDYHQTAAGRNEPTLWPTPRPGWDRIRPDFEAWLDNLRAESIQVLVIARTKPEDGDFNVADSLSFPIERTWAESHPELFVPLYGIVEQDPEMRLYRLRSE